MHTDNYPLWHPFAPLSQTFPIEIVKGEGTLLYSSDNQPIIDAISSWWVNLHGHAQPQIAEAIAAQAKELEQVIFANFTHKPALQLAKNLLEILPDAFEKIFFSDNGSTAVEVAIKMTLQYAYNQGLKKTKIIAFENAYHGDTFGAMSVSGRSAFNAPYEDCLFEVIHLPVPQADTIEKVKERFRNELQKGGVAAFIYEPLVQGSSGMLMYQAEHLDQLIELAQSFEVLCIADEVMTGFGRTAKLLASNYMSHKPDLICFSKGITGGFMPLGVTAISSQVLRQFTDPDPKKMFFHGHSYTANPLACAAANASYQLLRSENCQKQIERISEQNKAFVAAIQDDKRVRHARCCGTIMAFDLQTAESTSYFNSVKQQILDFSIREGVLLRPLGNVIYSMPPYCITETELKKVFSVMQTCIAKFAS
jgi:adenosylmethionine---8-amino-7-oxononanoate aminotransferase